MKPLSIKCRNLTCIMNQSWPKCSWQLQNDPQDFIFSIAMVANYSFDVKNIDGWTPTFFKHNNSFVATVMELHQIHFKGQIREQVYFETYFQYEISISGHFRQLGLQREKKNPNCDNTQTTVLRYKYMLVFYAFKMAVSIAFL